MFFVAKYKTIEDPDPDILVINILSNFLTNNFIFFSFGYFWNAGFSRSFVSFDKNLSDKNFLLFNFNLVLEKYLTFEYISFVEQPKSGLIIINEGAI